MGYRYTEKTEGDTKILSLMSEDKEVYARVRCRWRTRVLLYRIEVAEEKRRQGIGSALMHELVKRCIEDHIDCIECFLPNAQNGSSEEEDDIPYFLWRCGFTPWQEEEEETRYVFWLWDEEKEEPADRPYEPVPFVEGRISPQNENPVIDSLGAEDMICGSCLYRMKGRNTGECHKYSYKLDEIITDDRCDFYVSVKPREETN